MSKKEAKGKIREDVAKITGNESQKIKGKAEQVKGKVKEAGKVKRKL